MPLILPSIWIYIRQDKWIHFYFRYTNYFIACIFSAAALFGVVTRNNKGCGQKRCQGKFLFYHGYHCFYVAHASCIYKKKFRPAFPYIFTSKTIPASKNKTTTAEITQSFFLSFVFDKSSPNIDKFLFLLID